MKCPHVSYGSIKGGKYQSKPRQQEDLIPTSFNLYEWVLKEHDIRWKRPKGQKKDDHYKIEYFVIPPSLWFEFFGTAAAEKFEPCAKCKASKK